MSYEVYRVEYKLNSADPDFRGPRYHNAIFVETNTELGDGVNHHVIGTITDGMVYESNPAKQPHESPNFVNIHFLGTIQKSDYPDKMNKVLKALEPPPKQKALNSKTNEVEQIKKDGTFYKRGEALPSLIKCTEWTINQAIPALYKAGYLKK